jgi:hypothetical protein
MPRRLAGRHRSMKMWQRVGRLRYVAPGETAGEKVGMYLVPRRITSPQVSLTRVSCRHHRLSPAGEPVDRDAPQSTHTSISQTRTRRPTVSV